MKDLTNYINEDLFADEIRQLFRKQHVKTPKFIEKLVTPAPILIDWNEIFEKCWDNIVEREYPCKVSEFWKKWDELIGILNERGIKQTDFLTWLKAQYVDKHAMDVVVDTLFPFTGITITNGIDEFIDAFEKTTKH